jgi:4-oxalocrotonate tautomerase
MPLVNVKLIKGVFSAAQKKAIIKGITEAMVAVEGEALRKFVWVVIDEVNSGQWAMGGKLITAAAVKAMITGKAKNKNKNKNKNKSKSK